MTDATIPVIVPGQLTILRWDPSRPILSSLLVIDMYLCGALIPENCQLITTNVSTTVDAWTWPVPSDLRPSFSSQILAVHTGERLSRSIPNYVVIGKLRIVSSVISTKVQEVVLNSALDKSPSTTPSDITPTVPLAPSFATPTESSLIQPSDPSSPSLAGMPMTVTAIFILSLSIVTLLAILSILLMICMRRRRKNTEKSLKWSLPPSSSSSLTVSTVTTSLQQQQPVSSLHSILNTPRDTLKKSPSFLTRGFNRITAAATIRNRIGSNGSDMKQGLFQTNVMSSPRDSCIDEKSEHTYYPWDPRDNDPVATGRMTSCTGYSRSNDLSETSFGSHDEEFYPIDTTPCYSHHGSPFVTSTTTTPTASLIYAHNWSSDNATEYNSNSYLTTLPLAMRRYHSETRVNSVMYGDSTNDKHRLSNNNLAQDIVLPSSPPPLLLQPQATMTAKYTDSIINMNEQSHVNPFAPSPSPYSYSVPISAMTHFANAIESSHLSSTTRLNGENSVFRHKSFATKQRETAFLISSLPSAPLKVLSEIKDATKVQRVSFSDEIKFTTTNSNILPSAPSSPTSLIADLSYYDFPPITSSEPSISSTNYESNKSQPDDCSFMDHKNEEKAVLWAQNPRVKKSSSIRSDYHSARSFITTLGETTMSDLEDSFCHDPDT